MVGFTPTIKTLNTQPDQKDQHMKNYVTYLENSRVAVVDRVKLQKLSTNDLSDALKDLYVNGDYFVKLVDSSAKFFSKANLRALLDDANNTRDLSLVLEQRGTIMNDQQLDLVRQFNNLREDLLNAGKGSYPFTSVPGGWSIENNLVLNKTTVRRKEGNNHSIGYKTLKKIWDKAAPWWSENDGVDDAGRITLYSVQAGGYNRDAVIKQNRVDIGCQHIDRHEIEQVALHLGWEFPDV
jgi:hypothetical protein